MSELGLLIKSKRESAGLSQKKLGIICGMSDTTISKIEAGSRVAPQWDTLCRIAQALNFHPFEILLAAGYITADDIHPCSRFQGLDNLHDTDLREVQLFIDFLQMRNQKIAESSKEVLQCSTN